VVFLSERARKHIERRDSLGISFLNFALFISDNFSRSFKYVLILISLEAKISLGLIERIKLTPDRMRIT